VLDIGCGEGKFGAMLLNKKCQLYGIDIDSEACRNASEKYKYNKIFCTNIEAPDYADEGFAELESLSFEFDYIALIVKPGDTIINNLFRTFIEGVRTSYTKKS
jgi:ribosomal protein L11 methylase PrmA